MDKRNLLINNELEEKIKKSFLDDKNLTLRFPEIAVQWHPTKNGNKKPENFSFGSSKRVWWKCPKGEDHEWETAINSRTRKEAVRGCPFCSGKRVSKDNNLQVKYPEIAAQWHPTKNGNLKPDQVMPGTQRKIWWKCNEGSNHEWIAPVSRLTSGKNCPFCAGKRIGKDNNLKFKYPEIAAQWHPTKNGFRRPQEFPPSSTARVWWKCAKGKDHEWETTINSRTHHGGTGCPFCINQKASNENNLMVNFPDIAKEWHPTKNGKLKPWQVVGGSNKKVWWKCINYPEHEWSATIFSRAINGNGCRFCNTQTSVPEIRIYCELLYLFGNKRVLWRSKIGKEEIDIFIPDLNLGIEYDGAYWHKDKTELDVKKNNILYKKGIKVFRVRSRPLDKIEESDYLCGDNILKKDLNKILKSILNLTNTKKEKKHQDYITFKTFKNEIEFKKILSYLPSPPPDRSFAFYFPEIATLWDFEKNSPLKPEQFLPQSEKKVWWKCSVEPDHRWFGSIANRTRYKNGVGCPFCSGKRVSNKNNLKIIFPILAKQWHPTKNGKLRPEDILSSSSKKVWWKCPKGEDHEWVASPNARKGGVHLCPFCSNKKISQTNNLAYKFPAIADEWHPTKNGDLKPHEIFSGSGKKVWWKCPKSKDHEWKTSIEQRTGFRKTGCPFCKGRKVMNRINS